LSSANVFNGKIALISGAGSGMGLELAKEFGSFGAIVVGTDINPQRVHKMLQTLTSLGVTAHGYCVDHARREQLENLYTTICACIFTVALLRFRKAVTQTQV
jgi:NAD(P)-dependent dehydrogenase (short-subunit alcohol dehydrogenase family)